MFERILVNLDGSAEAELVLPIVEKLVACSPTQVVLLRVAHRDTPYEPYSMQFGHANAPATERDLINYLEAIAARLRSMGATTYSELSYAEPLTGILEVAQRYQIDLMAMVTHQHTGLDRLLNRGVMEAVMHKSPCPLLLVRTPDAEDVQGVLDDAFEGLPRN